MRIVRSIIATTHLDRHRDKFTREALEDAAAQLGSDTYVPMLWNHDPRVPPIGRAISAEVVQRADGEFNLEVISEVFEPGEIPPLSERVMGVRTFKQDHFTLVKDRSYAGDGELFVDLSENQNISVEVEEKKALDPLSILLLGLGCFAGGFIGKMGGDTWEALKLRIGELLARRRQDRNEYLFVLEVQVERPGGFVSLFCLLDTPSSDDLEQFWTIGLAQLRALLPILTASSPDILRFVLQFKEGTLLPVYAVRKDCVPLDFQITE